MNNRLVQLYFLCIQNRCRSQIAEAYAKHYGGKNVIINSAGIEPSSVHPYTVEVMKEVGIDISAKQSKPIDMKYFMSSSAIIKLCEEVNERCPVVPFGIRNFQWNLPDPLKQGQQLEDVRKTRLKLQD